MSRIRALLDASPIASIALSLMREATGRPEPLVPLAPSRPAALARGKRVGLWSLAAGAGASTVAALLAHRSAAGGEAPLLIDLDRWAPSLALRAGIAGATIADVLLQPGRERELLSRWAAVPFLPGAPALHAALDPERIVRAIEECATGRAAIVDLGAGADALDDTILGSLDRLCLVTGPTAAQLQAGFCGAALLQRAPCAVGTIVVRAADEDARRISERIGFPLLGAIPPDPYLANDDFAARAPTLRAIDAVVRSLA